MNGRIVAVKSQYGSALTGKNVNVYSCEDFYVFPVKKLTTEKCL